jgi:hypothetical protein
MYDDFEESVNRGRTDKTMAKGKRTKVQQQSTKHTHKAKDRVTRTSLKSGGEGCFGAFHVYIFSISDLDMLNYHFRLITEYMPTLVLKTIRYVA